MLPGNIRQELLRQIDDAINDLPVVSKDNIRLDDACCICMETYGAIYERAERDESRPIPGSWPTPEEPNSDEGVTMLEGCGHMFCRKDMIEWIKACHNTCPVCRNVFTHFYIPTASEYESSDGGEYVPSDGIDEEEDAFSAVDGYSDLDLEALGQSDGSPEWRRYAHDEEEDGLGGEAYPEREFHDSDIDPSAFNAALSRAGSYPSDSGNAYVDHPIAGPSRPNVYAEQPDWTPHFASSTRSSGQNLTYGDHHPIALGLSVSLQDDDEEDYGGYEFNYDYEDEDPQTRGTGEEDEDEEMDSDYVPMDEDDDYESSGDETEPSFGFDSEGMYSELEDLSMDEMQFSGAYHGGDNVSVCDAEDDMGLPDHEKGLTSPNRPHGLGEGSKRRS